MTDANDQLRKALAAAGARLAAADRERDAAIEQVSAALKAADEQLPIKTMAELTGVSRVTAYRLLGRM